MNTRKTVSYVHKHVARVSIHTQLDTTYMQKAMNPNFASQDSQHKLRHPLQLCVHGWPHRKVYICTLYAKQQCCVDKQLMLECTPQAEQQCCVDKQTMPRTCQATRETVRDKLRSIVGPARICGHHVEGPCFFGDTGSLSRADRY